MSNQKYIFIIIISYISIFLISSGMINAEDGISINVEEAVIRSNKYIGNEKKIEQIKNLSQVSSLKNIESLKIPFLHKNLEGKKMWEIIVNDSLYDYELEIMRPFEYKVYINEEDGSLLKIESECSDTGFPKYYLEPTASELEEMYKMYNFHEFIIDTNLINFKEAILATHRSPLKAKYVKALLVNISYAGKNDTIPVWIITFRGAKDPLKPRFNPNRLSKISWPEEEGSTIIFEIHALTGRMLSMGTENIPGRLRKDE